MNTSPTERREVYYEGQVQGVGFRYRTLEMASRYRVTGFVRNLPDGRVHLVVEGEVDQLDRLLEDIRESMDRFIRHQQADRSLATGEFSNFEISH